MRETGVIKNIIKNTYYGCCMAFKREILEKAYPFPENKEIGHDLWLGLTAEKYGKLFFSSERLIYFRRHENTVTHINKSNRSLLKKIYGRIIIIFYLLKLYRK